MMLRINEYQYILLMVWVHDLSTARAIESTGAGKRSEIHENKLSIFSANNVSKYIGTLTSTIDTYTD